MELLQGAGGSPLSQQEQLTAAFEKLHVALQEMSLVESELYQQNEELAVATQTVEAERQRYQDLFEFAPDGYLLTDLSGTILEANRVAATMLNVSQQFLQSKPLVTFVAQAERLAFHSKLTRLRQADGVQEWEFRMQPRHGNSFDAALTLAVAYNRPGKRIALRICMRDITKRKQTESALQKWATIFEYAQWGIAIESVDGATLEIMNSAFAQMHGYTLEELVGRSSVDLIAPECGEDLAEYIRIVNEQDTFTLESNHIRKDGSIFPVLKNVILVNPQDGSLPYRAIHVQDISNRKGVEEELREKQERLDVTQTAAKFGSFECNTQTNFCIWTKELEALYGLMPGELGGTYADWTKHVHPTDLIKLEEDLRVALSTGDFFSDFRVIWPDSSIHWLHSRAKVFFNNEGIPLRMVGVNLDITLRKQAEEALQQLNANLESLVQKRTLQLQQALDFEAMLKRITDKVRDGVDESQIMQTTVQELTLGLGLKGCNTAQYDLTKGTSTIRYEYITDIPAYRHRAIQMAKYPEIYNQLIDGQHFQLCSLFPNPERGHVAILACPILNGLEVLGDLWLINSVKHNFNELEIRLVQQVANQCTIAIRQARLYQASLAQVQELEKLNQLKDDFLSTVSHELRTPVSNMKMAIQMLKVSGELNERVQHYLEILQVECNREISLINDLLDLQRLENVSYSGGFVESINLQAWLPIIIEPLRISIQQHHQTLQLNLSPDLPKLFSDYASLKRILTELINNACKYSPDSAEIKLNVCYNSTTAATVFSISNPVEIPAEELPRIFDKFYRVPNLDAWKQGGTGLGLALVQKLVEQLQGTIFVESSGGWTTFTVQLSSHPRD